MTICRPYWSVTRAAEDQLIPLLEIQLYRGKVEPLLRLLKAVMIVWTATWLQPKEQCSVSEQA